MNANADVLREAACSCGQLRATVRGEPLRISVCHCHACQRRTGSVFGMQARFARAGATFSGDSTHWSRTGESGGTARAFDLKWAADLIAQCKLPRRVKKFCSCASRLPLKICAA